jgi:hypothetical protein
MHDTTVDEYTGESIRMGLSKMQINELSFKTGFSINEIETGLWPAVTDFLANNCDWVLHERFFNNNGLTILKRLIPLIPLNNFKFKIEYGISDCRIDVTKDALDKCILNDYKFTVKNYIFIPQLDYERAQIFGDPLFKTIKSIFINNVEYVDGDNPIYLNLLDGLVTTENPIINLKSICFEWTSKKIDISLNCLNYLYKLGFRMFFIQFTDDYTFNPTEYYNIDNTKQILINNAIKCLKGLVWCK